MLSWKCCVMTRIKHKLCSVFLICCYSKIIHFVSDLKSIHGYSYMIKFHIKNENNTYSLINFGSLQFYLLAFFSSWFWCISNENHTPMKNIQEDWRVTQKQNYLILTLLLAYTILQCSWQYMWFSCNRMERGEWREESKK